MSPSTPTIDIEYQDEENSFHTSYKSNKYPEYATKLQRALNAKLSSVSTYVEVRLNPGPGKGHRPMPHLGGSQWFTTGKPPRKVRYPRLGAFEVTVNTPPEGVHTFISKPPCRIVAWSKLDSRVWPDVDLLSSRLLEIFECCERGNDVREQIQKLHLPGPLATPMPVGEAWPTGPPGSPKARVGNNYPLTRKCDGRPQSARGPVAQPPMFFALSPRTNVPPPAAHVASILMSPRTPAMSPSTTPRQPNAEVRKRPQSAMPSFGSQMSASTPSTASTSKPSRPLCKGAQPPPPSSAWQEPAEQEAVPLQFQESCDSGCAPPPIDYGGAATPPMDFDSYAEQMEYAQQMQPVAYVGRALGGCAPPPMDFEYGDAMSQGYAPEPEPATEIKQPELAYTNDIRYRLVKAMTEDGKGVRQPAAILPGNGVLITDQLELDAFKEQLYTLAPLGIFNTGFNFNGLFDEIGEQNAAGRKTCTLEKLHACLLLKDWPQEVTQDESDYGNDGFEEEDEAPPAQPRVPSKEEPAKPAVQPKAPLQAPAPGTALRAPAPGTALQPPAPGTAIKPPSPGTAIPAPAPGTALPAPVTGTPVAMEPAPEDDEEEDEYMNDDFEDEDPAPSAPASPVKAAPVTTPTTVAGDTSPAAGHDDPEDADSKEHLDASAPVQYDFAYAEDFDDDDSEAEEDDGLSGGPSHPPGIRGKIQGSEIEEMSDSEIEDTTPAHLKVRTAQGAAADEIDSDNSIEDVPHPSAHMANHEEVSSEPSIVDADDGRSIIDEDSGKYSDFEDTKNDDEVSSEIE